MRARERQQTAVVIGSSGLIGGAVVRHLESRGWVVMKVDIAPGPDAIRCDIREVEDIRRAAQAAVESVGQVDGVVNCAGTNDAVEVWSEHPAIPDDAGYLDVNVRGAANVLEVFSERLAAQGSGAIVTVASLYSMVASDPRVYAAGPVARDKAPMYGASKAAVTALVRHYAVRYAPHNVRINSLSPGGIENAQPSWFLKLYSDHVPMGRLATTDDVVGVIEFLISGASTYLTAQNIVLDGGYSAW